MSGGKRRAGLTRPAQHPLPGPRVPAVGGPTRQRHQHRDPRPGTAQPNRTARCQAALDAGPPAAQRPTIATADRIAGLFILLYAQPLSAIARVTIDRITTHDAGVHVQFGDTRMRWQAGYSDGETDHGSWRKWITIVGGTPMRGSETSVVRFCL
jgi:hypothetical protein